MIPPDPTVRMLVQGRGRDEDLLVEALQASGVPFELVTIESLGFASGHGRRAEGETWLNRVRSAPAALAAMRFHEALGARCVNAPEVIARCADRVACAAALTGADVPVPESMVAFSRREALRAAATLGYPVTVTPVSGGGERWAMTVPDERLARSVLRRRPPAGAVEHAIHVRAAQSGASTVRVVVAGERAVAAWRADEHESPRREADAAPAAVELGTTLTELILAASRAVGGGLLSVDLIESATGPTTVDRVRSIVDVEEASRHTGVDVARACVEYLLELPG